MEEIIEFLEDMLENYASEGTLGDEAEAAKHFQRFVDEYYNETGKTY